jgi:DNA-binding winged helix-turn-helix (wHTH) protein
LARRLRFRRTPIKGLGMSDSLASGFRLAELTVQPNQGRIVSLGGEAHVEPRAMDVLVVLARRAGDTVSRNELIEAVWKHSYVCDEALSRCISLLRHALGDDRSNPRFVETIPKRGYRLMMPVQLVASTEPVSPRAGIASKEHRTPMAP